MIIIGLFIVLAVMLLIAGLPVYACFSLAVIGMIYALGYNSAFAAPTTFFSLNSFTIMAIPFFIYAGGLMRESGISERLVSFVSSLMGRVRGGLASVIVIAGGFFGAVTGSAAATISAIGQSILPELDNYGYPRKYSAALLSCCGLLGQLIPPSIPLILFGMITGTSVAASWLGAATPGVLLIIFYIIINQLQCRRIPEIKTTEKLSTKETVRRIGVSSRRGFFALLTPVIILGGIYSGLFTPTEAAAISVFYALLVGFLIYKGLSLKSFLSISRESVSIVGAALFIMFFILILCRVFTYERVPMIMAEGFMSVSSNPVIILLMINLFLLIVGMFIDDFSSMLLLAPLLWPLFMELGIHPIHMGAILVVNQGTGMNTPPVATNLYITARVSNVEVSDFIKHTIPFLIFGNIPVLLITTYIPEVSLWLPRLVMGI